MQQNIPLAILIVVVASLFFAGGATIQHYAVTETGDAKSEQRHMTLKELWQLVRTPRWLLGLGCITVGATLHIVGLMLAPVTVVQPVGILAVPWSVLLAARVHKHKTNKMIWGGVALTVLGILVFTLLSASHATEGADVSHPWAIPAACVVVYLCGATLGFLGARGPRRYRSFMWASGGSFFYGLASAMVRTVTEIVRQLDWTTHHLFWISVPLLIGTYVLGGWMIQQAYATGPAEGVVGSMTTTDPVVAVVFGLAVLGEGAHLTLGASAGMFVSAVVAVLGVLMLIRYHPEVQAQLAASDVGEPASDK